MGKAGGQAGRQASYLAKPYKSAVMGGCNVGCVCVSEHNFIIGVVAVGPHCGTLQPDRD